MQGINIFIIPAYAFYAKLVSLDAQEPMSGMTIVNAGIVRRDVFEVVVRESRDRYGNFNMN